MRRIINLMLAGLCFTILFISCTKEYSVENGALVPGGAGGGSQSGTAVFTLTGAPGACATPAITGNYIVGAPLDISNTVILSVDVTTIGTYTISTGSANGMAFSGTGTFTITGTQVIVLNGSGTPAAAGTNTFSPGTNGCSFQITASTVVIPPAAGTLDCATATLAGTYTQSIALSSANTITIPVTVTTAGAYSITTASTNGVTFTGSGNLALGAQSIVLTGAGTPTNAGAVSIPVSLGASNCSVSITFLPAPPPAVGVLDCVGITVAGTYTEGTALGASNTISIPVNVTTAGLYSVTSTANGVTFSASGTIATGAQTIVLTGSGIPTNSAAVTFNMNFGASNCGTSITFAPGLPATDYFRVKIDGVLTTFHVNLLGDDTPLFGGFTDAVEGDVAVGSSEHLDITVNDGFNPIAPGTYLHPLGLKFATSRYEDASGLGWQPADASSPAFSVVVTAVSATRITGTFSGQYKSQNGTGTGSKIFTEGEFSVPIP